MALYRLSELTSGTEQIRAMSGINVALGVWLIVSPLVLSLPENAAWNSVLCGIAVTALGLLRIRRPDSGTRSASWINALIGVWLLVAPFVVAFESAAALWNDVVIGAVLLTLSLVSASWPWRRAGDDTRARQSAAHRPSTRSP